MVAADHMIFLGTQPKLTQVPPNRPCSMINTLAPWEAARRAVASPALPAPITIKSYIKAEWQQGLIRQSRFDIYSWMTSFVRLSGTKPQQNGGRTWQGLSVYSTGCHALDAVLMGGVPAGSVLLVQEDWPRSSVNFASLFLKSFTAESVCKQERCLFLTRTKEILDSLPDKSEEQVSTATQSQLDDKFKIAWRYKHLQHAMELPQQQQQQQQSKTSFDFGKKLPVSLVNKYVLESRIMNCDELKNVSRVSVHGLGSPNHDFAMHELMLFVQRIREQGIVCMITIPSYCMDVAIVKQLQHLSDCVLSLDSVAAKSAGAECFLSIVKPFTFIKPILPNILSMSVKLDKKRMLVVEPFYLPPDDDHKASSTDGHGECSNKQLQF